MPFPFSATKKYFKRARVRASSNTISFVASFELLSEITTLQSYAEKLFSMYEYNKMIFFRIIFSSLYAGSTMSIFIIITRAPYKFLIFLPDTLSQIKNYLSSYYQNSRACQAIQKQTLTENHF